MLSKKSRLWGAILLVSGTTIGAGMLVLPVITGPAGFFLSLLLMTLLFLFMMMTAFYLLEVNLKVKGESNIISMVHKTLGKPGEVVAWISYLLLLYALTAAYLVGCSQILTDFLQPLVPAHILKWGAPLSIFVVFGSFLYFGIAAVDMLNRILMMGLFASYALLFSMGVSYIDVSLLTHSSISCLASAISVVVTSFGYHIIIPSLSIYLEHDSRMLKKAIVIGSLIPFLIYVAWQFLALGVIPVQGECSLTHAQELGLQATFYLKQIIGNPLITTAARGFAFFAIVTSLLGVSLSLSDFLSDGFKIKKNQIGRFFIILLTFIPPLFFALFYPQGFILALKYAGIFVVILLAILPTLMAWRERYGKERGFRKSEYKVWGGKGVLLSMIVLSFILLIIEVVV